MKPKIVVAEDEADIRRLICFSLQTLGGFDVIETTNGRQAVEAAMREKPNLVLLDVRMPVMDGHEACRQLRNSDKTGHIPVVFLSARGQESDIKLGKEIGATDYILKPFAPDELVRRIRSILDARGKG